ncbi:MAG: ATP-binding protein [Anaerolineales bacterium]|nr:ATP-binding protein [Anaerolineales bacterium]
MRIAVASGKGGTGKTTIATSLALSLADPIDLNPPVFLDCDVEAPNAHIYLNPDLKEQKIAGILIPEVDESQCTYCGICAEVCQYHAMTVISNKVIVFPQLCHGCGSCSEQCPEKAIKEIPKRMGVLERGMTNSNIVFARGVMDVGEAMAVPIIRQLKKWVEPNSDQVVIIDAPPGASCPVVESIRGSDYLVLVTEPTPFGLHDLNLASKLADELKIPAGIIINRDNGDYNEVEDFCVRNNYPILMRIPFERYIAEGLSQGKSLIEIHPEYIEKFKQLHTDIKSLIGNKHETNRTIKR